MSSRYNPCRCCQAPTCNPAALSRRGFLSHAAGSAVALPAAAAQTTARRGDPDRQQPIRNALRVQPVLVYEVPKRVEARSWRQWGAIQTEAHAAEERNRIERELKSMGADFPLEIRPLESVTTVEQAVRVAKGDADVVITYAAGGGARIVEALAPAGKWNLMFVRHRSGPVYLWYEIAHPRFLRKTVDEYGQPGSDAQDVIVDNHAEILWRLRALAGVKNTMGKTIVAVGGASGWGAGGRRAAELSREIWKLDIRTVGYPELGERIQRARTNDALVRRSAQRAQDLVRQKGVTLETKREFVNNAFLLTEVLRDLLDEAKTDALTINQCMGTIMPISETTACLPLSILNDDGYMAFCESDFVVIPSGILLRYISGKPVFLNDPTYPHDDVVTLAHCTAPRRMDGEHSEPVRLVTHFESDYGAAPKVEMTKGRKVTTLDPDFGGRNWIGFEGEITAAPFMPICRSQIDVGIKGSCDTLVRDMKGFHWMTCYGSYLKESGYALKKAGVKLQVI